jgi:hypothetical protein
MVKYAQCMRSHGISKFPDPNADGAIELNGAEVDSDSPQFKAAEEACKSLLPGNGPSDSGGGR